MEKKGGFLAYLRQKRFSVAELFEAFVFLPFAYEIIRVISGKFDYITIILAGVLLFIYAPALIAFLNWRRR